ncbi:MAG: hypothetical protein C0490_12685 [Marivirga sp.]|nr:hypothetical protein [Marivirga sp.]
MVITDFVSYRMQMNKDQNLAVQALFLDADRNPIKNQKYKIIFNGLVIQGSTDGDGLTKRIYTQNPSDEVKVAIERIDGSLKIVAQVVSGFGSKLVTLVSPKIKLDGPTRLHPNLPLGKLPEKNEKTVPVHAPKTDRPPTINKQPGVKTDAATTPDGRPLIAVSGDIPTLEFLTEYNGEVMGESDFLWAAHELNIDLAAIKAFAEVESKGSGFIKIGQRIVPKILYERHKFAKFTDNQYSRSNPDISLPCQYYTASQRYVLADESYKKKRKVPIDIDYYRPVNSKDDEETVKQAASFKSLIAGGMLKAESHKYLDGLEGYRRLIKAYQLDPEAALKSCSWGAFQIMGEFWNAMKYRSVTEFTRAVSRSEKEQVRSFVLYMKYVNPKIGNLLRELNWEGVASEFNGPTYKQNEYDKKLKIAYERFGGNRG